MARVSWVTTDLKEAGWQISGLTHLLKLGVSEDLAWQAANSRRGYWFVTHTLAVNIALTKERLIHNGFYDLATAYQSVYVNY